MSPPTRLQFLTQFSSFIGGFNAKLKPFRNLKVIGGVMTPPYEICVIPDKRKFEVELTYDSPGGIAGVSDRRLF